MNKKIQYQFDLQIHRVYIEILLACRVQVWWKRGKDQISTKKEIKLLGTEAFFDVNEKLSIMGNCRVKNGKFEPKQSFILLVIYPPNGEKKLGGSYPLNMTQILHSSNLTKFCSQKYQKSLENCPNKSNLITFTLSAKFIQQCSDSQNDMSFNGLSFSKQNDITFNQERVLSLPKQKLQRPMEFSFSPSNIAQHNKPTDRNLIPYNDNADLKRLIQEKNKEIANLQQQNKKLKIKINISQANNSSKHSQKMLSLMNELNSMISLNQQVKRQKNELLNNVNRAKQEKNQILANYAKVKQQYQNEKNDLRAKLQQRKKIADDYTIKMQSLIKQIENLKGQIFHKQSTIISLQNSYEKKIKQLHKEQQNIIAKNQMNVKEQAQKLISFKGSLKELKQNYDVLCMQRQQLQRQKNNLQQALIKQQDTIQTLRKQIKNLEQELRQQKNKVQQNFQMFQKKFKEKDSIINEIENQFKAMTLEKSAISRQREEEIVTIRQKFNSACKKIDELADKQRSYENKIREQQVRITNLQTICNNLEKELQEKLQLIEKAKIYVKSKQQQLNKKDSFIDQAKRYITEKQKEMNQMKQVINKQKSEIDKINSNKQVSEVYLKEIHGKDQTIQDLRLHLLSLQGKMDQTMEQYDQLSRKTISQQETLQDLVRKNLEMQIQLNYKNYELESVRNSK